MTQGAPWITYTQPRASARLRLFCFHFAGGAASVFRTWQNDLPEEVEVMPVQLPGREGRLSEGRLDSMEAVLDGLEPVVAPLMGQPPVVFFGHSMGGLIAFELTRRLRQKGAALPIHLFIAGRRGPRTVCRFPDIHDLSHEDLLEAMRKYGGTPEQVLNDSEMMDLLLPIIRADFKLLETYQYREEEALQIPLSIFAADQDVRTNMEELKAWRQETAGPFALRMFAGEHFFITTHRAVVLEALNQDLREILSKL